MSVHSQNSLLAAKARYLWNVSVALSMQTGLTIELT